MSLLTRLGFGDPFSTFSDSFINALLDKAAPSAEDEDEDDEWLPRVTYTENMARVETDMPGVTPDKLTVELNGRDLKITGIRDAETTYVDTVSFGDSDIPDYENTEAEIKNGVVVVKVPLKNVPSAEAAYKVRVKE